MKISVSEYQSRIKALRENLESERERDALRIAANMKTEILDRVQETGKDADGDIFGVYSDAYKRYRERNNLTESPYPRVNFKKTSRMWENTHVQLIERSGDRAVVRLAPLQQENIDKMQWNEERFGQIIELSDSEYQLVKEALRDRFIKQLRKSNLI